MPKPLCEEISSKQISREEILTQGTSIQQLGVLPKEPEVSAKEVDNVARKVSTDSCESLLFIDVRFRFSFFSFKAHSTTFLDFPIL